MKIAKYRVKPGSTVRLGDYDPADTDGYEGKADAEGAVAKNIERMHKLQERLYAENQRCILLVLQGLDASGKDGTVSHVMTGLNPMGVQVANFKQPTVEELDHDFLWRIHNRCPRRGEIGVFNRSHYEDVLIVRIRKLIDAATCTARYEQINAFERHLSENGTKIIKCCLHISKDEQRKRLQQRLADPLKNWKFEPGDLDVRKQWGDYQRAYSDMLSHTSTAWAPWHIVPADHKWFRNALVSRLMAETMEGMKFKMPKAKFDVKKMKVV
jgi:PPK2 family polyphosphate:nucleotide phosphotransferase